MYIRRFFAIFSLILVGGILVACGSDDDDAEPTATVAATEVAEADVEPTVIATEAVGDATPVSSPVATPVIDVATPDATVAAVMDAPLEATPDATAEADVSVPALPVAEEDASPESAEPEPTSVPMASINGTLTLDGRAQQDYSISDEGCVGLGEWRQLKPGTQVIVRDATGTVVDISQLEAGPADDTCSWSFSIEVPGADYFSISIPMVTEVWFDQNDPAVQSGELELFVP